MGERGTVLHSRYRRKCDDDGRHMASFTRTAEHERAGVASENTERWSELRKGLGGEAMGKAIRPEYVKKKKKIKWNRRASVRICEDFSPLV